MGDTQEMRKFGSVDNLVNTIRPENPIYCLRPNSIKKAVEFFNNNFPGRVLYAVKTNPNEKIIKIIISNGIKNFDVASINEIKLIRKIDNKVKIYFMHTVKSRESIKEAYFKYDVRDFALDTKEELLKILEATNNAKDLNLYVRIAISNEHAEIDLSRKFGALSSEGIGLLRLSKEHGKKVGLSFHVGSQCMDKISFSKGITEVGNIIKKTKIVPDVINIGGGFPSIYPDLVPEPLENYITEIKNGLKNLKLEKMPEVFCEPGRAIVAESGSTIVKVILKKKQKLYINDGTYGSLFDAGVPNFVLPTKMISNGRISKKLTEFNFYGPTCDSLDYMKGPFLLPNNIKEGDYIELGQLGAYGTTFRTKFNGFYSDEIYQVDDKPILSMYDRKDNVKYLVA
jgi:ornithine decarboxylase|tara:strand:+ start:12415 stop:13608 length:1194 start_codon:yes stop_codon:yes gene_type:complete